MATVWIDARHPEPFNVKYWGVGNENWGCGCYAEARAGKRGMSCPDVPPRWTSQS